MSVYLGLLKNQMRLAMREKMVIFFNYIFPLIFFFMFGELQGARRSVGAAQYLVSMVLTIGILGNGLFGVGIPVVEDRQQNILRRMHLAPISAAPVLFATLVAGLLVYLPAAVLTLFLANWVYYMPLPPNIFSVLVFLAIASLAFRSIGLIIASVANTVNEAQIIIQIIYFPMLFLSGITIPITALPEWLQSVSRFIPATYVGSGLHILLEQGDSIWSNQISIVALLITLAVGFFIAYQVFRWDKDDRIPSKARLLVAAILTPFLLLGIWENYRGTQAIRQAIIARDVARDRNWLIRDIRVFVGDGVVIDRANVYIRNGKIVEVLEDGRTTTESQNLYTIVEGAGKTLLPGLIDVHTHFGGPAVMTGEMEEEFSNWSERALKAYLYSGVTGARSVGDDTEGLLKLRDRVRSGELLAAELFMSGPIFTAPGGHGTEYFRHMPEIVRRRFEEQMAAAYSNPQEAASRVDAIAAQGVNGIKVVLDAGGQGSLFERLDLSVFDAIVKAAAKHNLPVVVHTGSIQDIRDATARNVAGLEHGAMRDLLPPDVVSELAAKKIRYDPTLSVLDSLVRLSKKDSSMLEEPLVRQTIPGDLLTKMRNWVRDNDFAPGLRTLPAISETNAAKNLKNVYAAGAPLVLGTDAGNAGVFHGPAVHREMELWKESGIAVPDILKAATSEAANLLGAGNRIGKVAKDYEANLLLVDGNPLEDISATRRISDVFFKGERVRRAALFQ